MSALHRHVKGTKLQRKRRRAEKKGLQDAQEAREGVQYAAGQFIADTTLTTNAPGPSKGKGRMCKK